MSDFPISTWIRFHAPAATTIPLSIFKPLVPFRRQFLSKALYGPIQEAEGEYMLLILWKTRAFYTEFQGSSEYKELMNSLESYSGIKPTTQFIDAGCIAYSVVVGVNTEIRTVYFPKALAEEVGDKVDKIRGLVTMFVHGIQSSAAHLCPYRGVPTRGWIEGGHVWNGESVVACVWIHHWTNKEHETRFKRRQRAWPKAGDPNRKPLAVDRFDEDLRELGAVGWEEYHVDFEQIPRVLEHLYPQGTAPDAGMMERLNIEPSRTD